MTLNYQLTLDDWLEAAKTMRSNDGLRRGSWLMLVFCCLLGVGYFLTHDNFYKTFAEIIVFCGVLFLLFVTVGLRFLWSNALRNNPDALLPVVLHINREELHFQKRDTDTQIKWEKYTCFRDTPNLFVLHWSPKVFQIIPKRAFANAAELEQFRAWASGIGQKDAPLVAPIPEP